MTIYNSNPTELQLDHTLQNISMTLQSLNNHLNNMRPATKTLNSGDRYLAREEHGARNDAVFGELALAGLNAFTGLDVFEGFSHIGGDFGEALMEAAQDIHELDAKNNMSELERALRLRRRRAYEEELRQERHVENESRKLKNMMTLMAMAVATLEERVKRREKREAKRSTLSAFTQNNRSIALKKAQAGKNHILTQNMQDMVVEAA